MRPSRACTEVRSVGRAAPPRGTHLSVDGWGGGGGWGEWREGQAGGPGSGSGEDIEQISPLIPATWFDLVVTICLICSKFFFFFKLNRVKPRSPVPNPQLVSPQPCLFIRVRLRLSPSLQTLLPGLVCSLCAVPGNRRYLSGCLPHVRSAAPIRPVCGR